MPALNLNLSARILSVVATSALCACVAESDDTTPVQFHLAFAGASDVRVVWKTNSSAANSSCVYGLSPADMTLHAYGTQKQYLAGHGVHHAVKLAPLAPATKYFYSCGGGAATPFVTAPPTGNPTNFSALIFGDWGYLDSVTRPPTIPVGGLATNWSATLTRQLISSLQAASQFNFTWIVGDIAYADDGFGHLGELLNFSYEDVYDGFMTWIQNFSSVMPLMVSVGNHESECHSPYCILNLNSTGLPLSNFSAFNARWAMPGPESGGVGPNMWYSWNYGGVHFVSLDTSTDFPDAPEGATGDSGFPFLPAGSFAPNGTYMAWLEADLAAARADAGTKWIIAGGHRPTEDFASDAVVALFKAYGVDLYLAGHGHSYYRMPADAYGDGTVHVMVGGAGCDEMPWPADQLADPVDLEEAAFASPRAACEAWCTKAAVRAAFAAAAYVPADPRQQGALPPQVPPENDPCRYCTAGGRVQAGAIYNSDNMAIGRLSVQAAGATSTLTWELLRAPDGAVLDTLVLSKPL